VETVALVIFIEKKGSLQDKCVLTCWQPSYSYLFYGQLFHAQVLTRLIDCQA